MLSARIAMALASGRVGRLAGRLALAAGAAMLAGAAAGAERRDVFEIADVAVDVTAETAAKAREQALVDGERLAFVRLLKRLALMRDHDRLPQASREEIASYVKDLEVEQEKTSTVRYIAKLTFRFKPREIRNFLTFHSIPFAETRSKPALVLPVSQTTGALLLWDDPNPWRDAWKARPPGDGLMPTVLPRGDLADIAAIGAEQAVAGDLPRLKAIGERYMVGDVIVAVATTRLPPGASAPALEVSVGRYGSGDPQRSQMRFQPEAGEGLDSLLRRAAVEATRRLEDAWKEANLLKFGDAAVVAVKAPVSGLSEWLAVQKRLAGVAVINRWDLVLLSREEARVNIHYIGDTEQLVTALEQADLRLEREGDEWLLRLTGADSRKDAPGPRP
jgi:hypothetical protein